MIRGRRRACTRRFENGCSVARQMLFHRRSRWRKRSSTRNPQVQSSLAAYICGDRGNDVDIRARLTLAPAERSPLSLRPELEAMNGTKDDAISSLSAEEDSNASMKSSRHAPSGAIRR